MIDSTQLAFTIAVGAVIILIYIFIKTVRKSGVEISNETKNEGIISKKIRIRFLKNLSSWRRKSKTFAKNQREKNKFKKSTQN